MAWAIDWTHQLEIRRQYGVDGHRLGVQSRKIQFSGTLIKKILLYARIHALNIKGAPGWPVGAQKTTKNS